MTVEEIEVKINGAQPVKREEAELYIRSTLRICKGPIKTGKHEEYGKVARESAQQGVVSKFPIRDIDDIFRDYCGTDVNDVILGKPFDGQVHIVNCPGCHNSFSFRAPTIILSD